MSVFLHILQENDANLAIENLQDSYFLQEILQDYYFLQYILQEIPQGI